MTPSLCGSFLTDKRSLVAFTWTLTTVFTFVAFVAAITMIIHLHTHYKFMENYYSDQYEQASNQNNQHNGENGQQQQGGQQQHNSGDNENKERFEYLMALSSMRSGSLSFAAAYTVMIAMAISLYGSTTIVGFTSLRGVYIQPCFSAPSSLKLGIFGGAIIFFANLLLVCAVVFGEVRVEDWRDYSGGGEGQEHEQQREDREPYEIERIATVLAVTCMFLAALYSIFAILLFLYYGSIENIEDDDTIEGTRKPLSSIVNDTRRENFITMGEET